MNAEALIGTVLGTCTLQRLIGQGGMGAVYLAQQSRPRRQVAVKVLLPMTPLNPNQLAAFLERFRRETDAAASLEHPNITPVHEYGERDGLAYLVMPYISGGTLRDEMEREGPLPLAKVVNYLDQIAAALDFAHEHGVIHRDIKPANILMTPEGRLLLTDFGLVKIVAEGQAPQVRLTGAGAPVGTPDYMAPEQVIGEEVDTRADLYSLGVILYQMVTGTTPFQGETPMQIAAQHLQIPPPSPQILRPDLPVAVEQVMLRSLAKRPSDRYPKAQELANAFRMALMGAGIQPDMTTASNAGISIGATNSRLFTPKGLFDPSWQTGAAPAVDDGGEGIVSRPTGAVPAVDGGGLLSRPTGAMPSFGGGGGLLSRTGMMPSMGGGGLLSRTGMMRPVATDAMPAAPAPSSGGGGLLSRTGKFPLMGSATGIIPAASSANVVEAPATGGLLSSYTMQPAIEQSPAGLTNTTTGSLMVPGLPAQQGTGVTTTVKLTGPVKVVKVPVAGQPGQFVTGILPVVPQTPEPAIEQKKGLKLWVKILALALAVMLLVGGAAGAFWYTRTHSTKQPVAQQAAPGSAMGTPDAKATAMAVASATAQANVILSDPLSTNIHNWLTMPADVYAFKDGAYHITDRDNNGRATVLQANPFTGPLGYSLTMEEINGNDNSANNSFGMIFRFTQRTTGGTTVTTFYSFEVVNTKGGEYQFWKYDDSKGKAVSPWTEIWHQPFGNEFHQGHGPQSVNTFKVFMNGKNFTFIVNGTTVKTTQDGSLADGTVGMIVNLNGTEVAFKNLLLTRN
jgi:hypothetical protein